MKTKLILILACLTALPTAIADSAHCGTEGVWIEILGAGSGELEDGQGPPSFLLWQDNVARLIVDTGSGSSVGFDRSGADIGVACVAWVRRGYSFGGNIPHNVESMVHGRGG